MVRFCSERYAARALGEFDLDQPTVVGPGIMIGGGGRQELEIEHSGGNYFADAAHQVAVGRKFAAGKQHFRSIDDAIERGEQLAGLGPMVGIDYGFRGCGRRGSVGTGRESMS